MNSPYVSGRGDLSATLTLLANEMATEGFLSPDEGGECVFS